MEALRESLARFAVSVATPRRRTLVWIAVGVIWVWPFLRIDVHGGPALIALAMVLRLAALVAAGLALAGLRGTLFGRPLPLPPKQLLRVADQSYRRVETWTSPLAVHDVLSRLQHLELSDAALTVQALPTGIHVRVRRRFQPETWPAAAPVPKPVRTDAGVLVFVSTGPDGTTTLTGHWDGTQMSGPLDVLRAHAQLGRDVVDAARRSTEQADREPDPTPGSDR